MTLDSIDISGDFLRVNNQAPIAMTVDGESQAGIPAVIRPVSLKESADSQGRYTTEDVVFLISQIDIVRVPEVGASIEEEGSTWTILSVRTDRITRRFRIVCRSSEVIGTVVIQTAVFSLDDNGVQVTTWEDSPEVPATVQRVSAKLETDHQVEAMKAQFKIFFLTGQTVNKNTRIKQGDSIFRPVGLDNTDSLSELFTVNAEEW